MADNSTQGGSDTIRDLARQAGVVKTQVLQIDIGGPTANAEVLVTAGQQTMAASLPVVIASNQPALSFAGIPANDSWGQALAVTNGATATLVSIPSASAGYRIKGVLCHGTGDGYFTVQIAAVTVFSGRTRSTLPMLAITLPNGIAVSTGAAVALKVTNESGNTADYEGTLLGE